MVKHATDGWERRDFLGGAALLALLIGIPVAAIKLDDLPADEAPTDRQRLLMSHVAQLVIPRTETPGAGDVGAGDFVLLALAHGLSGSSDPITPETLPGLSGHLRHDGSLRHADWLESDLDRRSNGNFLRKGIDQAKILGGLDAEAYADGMDKHPWRTIKTLILTGYYTSQAGGSQELRYEPVPGRWEPDLPVTPDTRAISNDWTAVDFG
ncbi:gluconate 2-dehydrogenase subunit 3 family protein [Sphingobium sp. DEHP117]|uniref:gluconate 2-dehydrogenase subunit 3 family protein n=1 Tax=Sphingobium sp. DEHP117 TaxID=2993436 RepID=UPI0027D7412B|nr:gluconate 2-dehydrogenase subunit 3 family protein [Sphingobium sp. DEHP117]MDQ4419301.1 gluconate 2-dehydrogenase subunit 3 family protein [Sphingobium sp. DEHP117]